MQTDYISAVGSHFCSSVGSRHGAKWFCPEKTAAAFHAVCFDHQSRGRRGSLRGSAGVVHGFGLKRTLASKLNIHPIDQHLCTEARCGWKANCGSREVPEYCFGVEENVGVKVEHTSHRSAFGARKQYVAGRRIAEAGKRRSTVLGLKRSVKVEHTSHRSAFGARKQYVAGR